MLRSVKLALFAASSLSIAACVPAAAPQTPDAPPSANAPAPFPPTAEAPYVAGGTEPFWALKIDGERVVFQPMEGESTVAENITVRPSFNGWRYTSDAVGVDVTFTQCSDGMSDIVYKDTVTVLVGTTEFRGCGGGAVTAGASLANTQWAITSVNGRDIYNPMGRGPLYVRFGQDRLSAATGCNGMGGNFVSGEGWLYAPMMMSTMMACDPRLMAQEQAIGAALTGHKPIRSGPEDAMMFGDEANSITLTPAGPCPDCSEMDSPASSALPEGEWEIQQIGNTPVGATEQVYRMNLTDGKVTGYAGCNRFFGDYTMDATTLTFGSIGATRMACPGGGGADERRVFDVLRNPVTYRIIGDDMMLMANKSGALMLVRASR